jgi:hypothetical protein
MGSLSHAIGTCVLPRLWWRSVGSMWCCPTCHKVWFVDNWWSNSDTIKEWSPLNGTR